jgi:hypothetical protein
VLWYQAFYCRCDPEELLAKVDDRIARCHLEQWVPNLCLQMVSEDRRGPGRARQVEFLLYLGLDSARIGLIPEQVEHDLLSLRDLHERHGTCPPDRVADIYADWKKRTQGRVLYRPPTDARALLSVDEPWRDVDSEAQADEGTVEQALAETRRYDRLLRFLSARGDGSWSSFCQICAALWPGHGASAPARILRRLRLLGHLAVAPDRLRWRVLPPLLMLQPSSEGEPEEGDAVFLLCGQRDRSLLEALDRVGRVREEPQPRGDGPAAVSVRVDDPTRLENLPGVSCCLEFAGCVGRLPTLQECRSSLPQIPAFATYEFEFRLYDGVGFHTTPSAEVEGVPGFYELWSLPTSEYATQTCERALYRDTNSNCWRSGDWYGLRFLSHVDRGWEGPILYRTDPEPQLIVPEVARPPETFERALVLSSGLLPERLRSAEGKVMLVYRHVTRTVAQIVAQKLSVQFSEAPQSVETEA